MVGLILLSSFPSFQNEADDWEENEELRAIEGLEGKFSHAWAAELQLPVDANDGWFKKTAEWCSAFFDRICRSYPKGSVPMKVESFQPKEKIIPIPDGSSFFILGKKNW